MRLVSLALQHRESRIFREARISRRPLAKVKGRTAIGFHLSHEAAIRTKSDARRTCLLRFFLHHHRIAPRANLRPTLRSSGWNLEMTFHDNTSHNVDGNLKKNSSNIDR